VKGLLPRNAVSFICEPGFFLAGMSCISFTTVLPTLIQRLGGSPLTVGLAVGIATGVYLLPQLFVAGIVTRLPRKKPITVAAVWIGRPLLLLMALAIWTWGAERPLLTLVLLLSGIALFHAGEAVQAVPWLSLLGTCVPPDRRGRVLGAAQVLGGAGGIAAGALVRWTLGGGGPWSFPRDYAVLFAAAGAAMLLSAAAMAVMREPGPTAQPEQRQPRLRELMARLPVILVRDRPFLRLTIVRLASDFVTVAGSFYVLHAALRKGFDSSMTGLFVGAQVLGGLASGFLMAAVHDRWGPRTHMRITIGVSLVPPLLALGGGAVELLTGGMPLAVSLLVFFSLGLYLGSPSWPFFNWTLEHAQEAERPLYIGIMNTLGALSMLAPPLGGWIVMRFSYAAVFACAAVCAVLALLLTRGLPDTRAR
jgi:MFS family permease